MKADRCRPIGRIVVLLRIAGLVFLVPLLGFAGGLPSDAVAASAEPNPHPPDPRAILARAFANQYEVNISANIELRMRNASGQERTRRFEVLQKIIGDRLHAIGRLTHPEYLRGMTILQIESLEDGHEAFIYLPSLQKVRRVSMLQRGDALFGTDVTYEDLERRHIEDYVVEDFEEGEVRGEAVFIVSVRPIRTQSAEKLVFYVAQRDDVILEVRQYKNGSPDPFRSISALRTGLVEAEGHVLVTRLTVRNLSRGTTTEVTFENMKVNPPIDDRVFSLRTLETERDIFRPFQ